MDYPANGTAYIASAGSFSLEGRRRRWPALDAIMKTGARAIPLLQKQIAGKSQDAKMRRIALSVSHDLAPEVAAVSGQMLLDEAMEAHDSAAQDAIQSILDRSDRSSIFLMRGQIKTSESKSAGDQPKGLVPR